jgi:hypothetical protein
MIDSHTLDVRGVLALGYLLGMLMFICVMSVIAHRNANVQQNFFQAAKIYIVKDIGPILVAIILLLAVLFMLPELLITGGTDPENHTAYDKLLIIKINQIRRWSILIGFAGQWIPFFFLSKAAKYFKSQLDSDVKPPTP